jgi:hypothetical protein
VYFTETRSCSSSIVHGMIKMTSSPSELVISPSGETLIRCWPRLDGFEPGYVPDRRDTAPSHLWRWHVIRLIRRLGCACQPGTAYWGAESEPRDAGPRGDQGGNADIPPNRRTISLV